MRLAGHSDDVVDLVYLAHCVAHALRCRADHGRDDDGDDDGQHAQNQASRGSPLLGEALALVRRFPDGALGGEEAQ